MKHLPACLLFLLFAAACSSVPDASSDRPLVSVDAAVITAADLRTAIALEDTGLQFEISCEPWKTSKGTADMKRTMLGHLIDQQLLVNEFHRIGGILKMDYVERFFTRLIQQHFNGKREAFLAELAKRGVTWEQFRHRQEVRIISGVMFARMGNRIEIMKKKLKDLRGEATIRNLGPW